MKSKNILMLFFVIFLVTLASPSYAQGGASLGSMFSNFIASANALINLVQKVSYVIGVLLVITAVYKFTQVGQGQITMKTPIFMFISGIGIFALTGTVSIVTASLAMGSGPGAILMPSSPSLSATSAQALQGVLLFIRLVGYIAFIRGWLLLNQHAQGKDGVLGRGLTHIFGGVAAINITITAKILANTFAPGVPMPF